MDQLSEIRRDIKARGHYRKSGFKNVRMDVKKKKKFFDSPR